MAKGQKKQAQEKIDKDEFEKLCELQCTEPEIASFFGVSSETIMNWCLNTYGGKTFRDVFKEKREVGKVSLRRIQFKHAKNNPTMAIWLGKQYLGQKDQIESVVEEKIQVVSDIPVVDDEE